MSNWNGAKSHWQFSKWIANIARNSRITPLEGTVELPLVRTALKLFWDPVAQTGTRPWLDAKFRRAAVGSDYGCDIDNEPAHVVCKLLEVVGRDLKKIPMTAGEALIGALIIVGTNNRNYGTTPYFGGVAGSTVTIP